MDIQEEIEQLKEKRQKVFHLDFPFSISILLGLVCYFYIPQISWFFGILAFIFFYKKMFNVVRIPCPRCKKAFGTDSKFVLSIGPNKCQNCGLDI